MLSALVLHSLMLPSTTAWSHLNLCTMMSSTYSMQHGVYRVQCVGSLSALIYTQANAAQHGSLGLLDQELQANKVQQEIIHARKERN